MSLSLYRLLELLVSDIKICIECRQLKPLMTLNVALNHAIQFLQAGQARQDTQADRQSGVVCDRLVALSSQLTCDQISHHS